MTLRYSCYYVKAPAGYCVWAKVQLVAGAQVGNWRGEQYTVNSTRHIF